MCLVGMWPSPPLSLHLCGSEHSSCHTHTSRPLTKLYLVAYHSARPSTMITDILATTGVVFPRRLLSFALFSSHRSIKHGQASLSFSSALLSVLALHHQSISDSIRGIIAVTALRLHLTIVCTASPESKLSSDACIAHKSSGAGTKIVELLVFRLRECQSYVKVTLPAIVVLFGFEQK